MNETCIKLVAQMVINLVAGRREQNWELYEKYCKERYLHVTVEEILRAKGYKKIA